MNVLFVEKHCIENTVMFFMFVKIDSLKSFIYKLEKSLSKKQEC